MTFAELQINEIFELEVSPKGSLYEKCEATSIQTFQPYNANEGPARYALRNARRVDTGGWFWIAPHEAVKPVNLSLF